jgi:tetratricopeptide (TPR) repeat protein
VTSRSLNVLLVVALVAAVGWYLWTVKESIRAKEVIAQTLHGQEALQPGDLGALNRALVVNPAHGPALNARSSVHQRRGEFDKALADIDRAVELMPGEAAVFFNRAELFRTQGEKEKAIADYTRALTLAPDSKFLTSHVVVLFGRSLCHSQLGHFPEAKADVAESNRLDPKPESLQLLEVIRQGLEILCQREAGKGPPI